MSDMDPGMSSDVRRVTEWDASRLRDLAAEYETPLYVYDLDRVRQNYRRLAAAFDEATVHYAAKANTSAPVLDALADEGAGVECASAGEVVRALEAGFPGERLHYTAVNPPARDLDVVTDLASEHDITIIAGAGDTVSRLAERGFDGRLCLRVHPGVGAGHSDAVRTGSDPKFGVAPDRAIPLLADAEARGFDVVGLHAHVGSGISEADLGAHRRFVEELADLYRASPVDLELLDIGGGFGVPYHREEPPLDIDAVARATYEALAGLDCELVIEPGRYLVADAGVLLSRVNTVKTVDATEVVGIDAGMTALVRPAMYDAFHDLHNLAPDAGRRDEIGVTVAGPICESADVLARDRPLAAPERGDLLAIGNAGAYGYEMASQYNSRPRPACVAIDGDDTWLVRERESIAAVTRGEHAIPRDGRSVDEDSPAAAGDDANDSDSTGAELNGEESMTEQTLSDDTDAVPHAEQEAHQ